LRLSGAALEKAGANVVRPIHNDHLHIDSGRGKRGAGLDLGSPLLPVFRKVAHKNDVVRIAHDYRDSADESVRQIDAKFGGNGCGTQRRLKFVLRFGSSRENACLQSGAGLNGTSEEVIDYPDPKNIDRSIFELAYPKSAKVIRYEDPAFIRSDEAGLKLLAEATKEYRSEHQDRFPTRWRKELKPYFRKRGPARPFLTSDEAGRPETLDRLRDPDYMSWKFEHTGQKYTELKEPDRTVIASHTYTGNYENGYRLVLYADGHIEVIRPAAVGKSARD